jgi:anti-sigma factor RsiW
MSGGQVFDEDELHAFLDGALDSPRREEVAARIASDPALSARLAAFRADKALLKQLYGPVAEQPLPPHWLALARQKPPVRPTWRLVGAIAAVLLVTMGAILAYRVYQPGQGGEIVAAALATRQQAGGETIALAQGDDPARYDAALSSLLSLRVKVPDLSRMGYRLAAIRLFHGGAAAAELRYRDPAGRVFTLYLRRSDGSARFDQFEQAGLRVCIWQDDQLGLVMAGNVSTAAMQRLASLAYTGLTL